MDMPRLEALSMYWKNYPPVHLSMAAYVGWGRSKDSAGSSDAKEVDIEDFLATLPTKKASI